jgi:hypothetical protein
MVLIAHYRVLDSLPLVQVYHSFIELGDPVPTNGVVLAPCTSCGTRRCRAKTVAMFYLGLALTTWNATREQFLPTSRNFTISSFGGSCRYISRKSMTSLGCVSMMTCRARFISSAERICKGCGGAMLDYRSTSTNSNREAILRKLWSNPR